VTTKAGKRVLPGLSSIRVGERVGDFALVETVAELEAKSLFS
jgi:hypothetical protein